MAKREIRPIRIEGNVAYVPLSKGREAIIDACDIPAVSGVNWTADEQSYTFYAYRRSPRPNRKTVLMHRLLLGFPGGFEVDHIDGNGLNNRRSNLRVATRSQNQCNKRLSKLNTSGLKGASFRKDISKWASCISFQGRQHCLGVFATKEEAHAAYLAASKLHHGSFGRGS